MKRTSVAALIVACLVVSTASAVKKPRDLEDLRAFAKLYGYVRFFHPSDEASRVDWDKFAVYGASRVRSARGPEPLRRVLEELFLPVAPTLRVYPTGQEPPGPAFSPREDTAGLKVVAWQHVGVGLGRRGPYESARTNRTRRIETGSDDFGSVAQGITAKTLRGRTIRLQAAVRTEVDGPGNQGQLWLRVDRPQRQTGFFDSMHDRPITSAEWRVFEIVGEVADDAEMILFGGFLLGKGALWLDSFALSVLDDDGRWVPVDILNPGFEASADVADGWGAASPGYRYRIDSDGAFEDEQCIRIEDVSGEVAGRLFDTVPVLGEETRKPLGAGLSCALPLALYGDAGQTLGGDGSHPVEALLTELESLDLGSLDAGDVDVRIGAVTIAWNILQHFYPYFDIVDTDWDAWLTRALREAVEADSEFDFWLVLQKLVAALHDGHAKATHADLAKSVAWFPLRTEWIGGQVVVTASTLPEIKRGDVVVAVDDRPAKEVLSEQEELVSGSTQWKRWRSVTRFGTGREGTTARVVLLRQDEQFELTVRRDNHRLIPESRRPEIEKLAGEVYYVDLTRVAMKDIQARIEQLSKARGLIFDLRGYPNGNHGVLEHLTDVPLRSAKWNVPRVVYPDRERIVGYETSGRWTLPATAPRFQGTVVFLTDARAISYAESVLGIVEHYRLGEIVGQPTAGTNGNVNAFELPGGFRVSWTGMNVLKHDDSRHHLVGIQPTVPVERTLTGVRDGRDEFLEMALEIIGRAWPRADDASCVGI